MSKRVKHDDGFMQLRPRKDKDPVNFTGLTSDDDASYWKKRYDALQKESEYKIQLLEKEIELLTDTIQILEESVKVSDRLISSLRDELHAVADYGEDDDYFDSEVDVDDLNGDEEVSMFTHGVGLSIARDSKFFHIEDGKRRYNKPSKKKLGGIDLEIQPGRGFCIAPRWEKD